MQFKHPEILFALLLLIIPIIIHLFHLQRFIKVPFTNVQFLKKIELQTRKSSQLKKWLILITRILLFSSIILAFSQPYFSELSKNKTVHTIIYLDNSLSMSYQIEQQEILKKSSQELINSLNNESIISLLTNDNYYTNLDQKSLKNILLNLNYSSTDQSFETIILRLQQHINNDTNTLYKIVLISDFQKNKEVNNIDVTNVNTSISLINVSPKGIKNAFIDSVYISKKNNQEIVVNTIIKNINASDKSGSISLYNNSILIGKTTTPFKENSTLEIEFKIPFHENFNGNLILNDDNLKFDNNLFFNISKPEKINVLTLGKRADFLPKIYTQKEFNYSFKNLNEINYNDIEKKHLIILNEIDVIPFALTSSLKTFSKNGGSIVIIPSSEIEIDSYNTLLRDLNIGTVSNLIDEELAITTINYDHPLLTGVFEKKIKNFQYPTVYQYLKTNLSNTSPIISLENEQAFISQSNSGNGKTYWFNSPLNTNATNFQNSPLIVPIFYNFGAYSFKLPQLYYTVGDKNTIDVSVNLKKDAILKVENNTIEFIPLQQILHNKVRLTTNDNPKRSDFYKITNLGKTLKTIAFNYNRKESILEYSNIENLFSESKSILISRSIDDTFTKLNEQQQIKSLFRWFLALAALFLLLEICILKFFKA